MTRSKRISALVGLTICACGAVAAVPLAANAIAAGHLPTRGIIGAGCAILFVGVLVSAAASDGAIGPAWRTRRAAAARSAAGPVVVARREPTRRAVRVRVGFCQRHGSDHAGTRTSPLRASRHQ
jgi:hypothetical protein